MAMMVNLTTALSTPLSAFEQKIVDNKVSIEAWFEEQWQQTLPPVYASVDLRNALFKVSPIDTNLFSAGFNNLNSELMSVRVAAMKARIQREFPKAKRILFIPEEHTRNTFYLENVAIMTEIIKTAGYELVLGSLAEGMDYPATLKTATDRDIILHEITREGDQLRSGDFVPDIIFLNNDLSGGKYPIFENIEQPIMPDPSLGWDQRLKSQHFSMFKDVAIKFSQAIDMDSWFVNPLYRNCGEVDFMAGEGVECLRYNAEQLFRSINKKYKEYNITEKPFIIVKADAGSYGMGVMSVSSPEELVSLNRKQRTHMAKTKGKVSVSKVILQEGVHTVEEKDGNVAEPVIYMIGECVVGGFYRMNTKRGSTENLNSPGMQFSTMPVADEISLLEPENARFYVYGVVARLAALASALELDALKKEVA
jgi:glutamate--cysteine ligase